MAAPANKTTKDLTGKWVMSKSLSDSAEPGLLIQGIGFFVRKGIGLATVTLTIKQFEAAPKPPNTDTTPVTFIEIEQDASGLSKSTENRCFDGVFRERKDSIFGDVKAQSTWVSLDEVTDDYLKAGWGDVDTSAKDFIRSYVESTTSGWVAEQIWGFQDVNGERRHVRLVVITKGAERAAFRLVYDFLE